MLKEKNAVGAALGLWWLGQSFIDVAVYAYYTVNFVLAELHAIKS